MKDYEEMASEVLQQRDDYEAKRTQRRKTLHRRLTTTLTALAIVLTVGAVGVGATAIISGADWFKGFYTQTSGGELTDNQVQYLEDNAVDVQQTVTSDGFTMTLGAVNYSRNRLDVYIDVVAPEGTSLKCVNMGNDFGPFTLWRDGNVIPIDTIAGGIIFDEDENDNKGTYLFMVYAKDIDGKEFYFSDAGKVTLVVDGLYFGVMEEQVSDGSWSFDINVEPQSEEGVVVLTKPIVCDAFDWITKEYTGVMQINSFTLHGMLGRGTYDVLETVGEDEFTYVNVKVVLKDGTTATATESNYSDPDDNGIKTMTVGFREPIILSEVDYVVFGGYEDENGNWVEGTRVDIP